MPVTGIARASTEILDTLVLMLEERDPRFVVEVTGELTNVFKWKRNYLTEKITELVHSRGKERGISTISFEDAVGMVYPNQPIYRIARPFNNREKHQKLFKNSRLFYLNISALTNYLRENINTELVVTFKA